MCEPYIVYCQYLKTQLYMIMCRTKEIKCTHVRIVEVEKLSAKNRLVYFFYSFIVTFFYFNDIYLVFKTNKNKLPILIFYYLLFIVNVSTNHSI